MTPSAVDPQTEQDPIEALGPSLRKLVQDDVRTDIDPEKVYQYSDIRRNQYYWRGIQFLRRKVVDGAVVDWSPVDGSVKNQDGSTVDDLYDFTINDVRGYGRKFIGVIAQQSPNVKAEPNRRTNEEHIRRSKQANSVGLELQGLWDIRGATRRIAFGFWLTGAQFAHTPFVADGDKYGYSEEPEMQDQDIQIAPAILSCTICGTRTPIPDSDMPPQYCSTCQTEFGPENYQPAQTIPFPVPMSEPKRYPNGCVELRIYSGMNVTTPFYIQKLSDTPWLMLEEEKHKGQILAAFSSNEKTYKRLREMLENDEISTDGASTAGTSGRTTRDLATSIGGTVTMPRKNRWLYTQVWLRPSMYEISREEIVYRGKKMLLKDAMREDFPNGVRVTMVQDKVVDLTDEKLDDVWALGSPETAENAYPDPLCKDLLSSQDLTNHCANTTAEVLERQIPQMAVDVDQINLEARKKFQLPASILPMRRRSGQSLRDAMQQLPVAKTEPEMTTYPTLMRELAAENVGITKAIYGAGEREQTAYATNLKRNQAMLQLSPALDALRELVADAVENGIKQMARHSGGRLPSQYAPESEAEVLDLEELLEGGWHVEPDDSMPMSWSERRGALLELMEKNPQSLGPLGFGEIDNIPIVQDTLIGLQDWKLPNSDALDKLNNCIRKLLRGKPVQKAGMDGQPVTLPSIPVDEFEDDHQFYADGVRRWSQTEDAQREREENPEGYSNVIAFGRSHAGLALQAGPPPGAPGAPSAPGAPPSGPDQKGPPQKLMPPIGGDSAQAAQHALQ